MYEQNSWNSVQTIRLPACLYNGHIDKMTVDDDNLQWQSMMAQKQPDKVASWHGLEVCDNILPI